MTTYSIERNDYDKKYASNGMNSTISNLKTRLFDLEQQEKDFDALNQKLDQLKKEYSNLSNLKNKLDDELKQKDEAYNQRISKLRAENEDLQQNYNEKLATNKKLFTENDALEKEIEARDAEIKDLKNKLRNLNNNLSQCLVDKGDLVNDVIIPDNLSDVNNVKNLENKSNCEKMFIYIYEMKNQLESSEKDIVSWINLIFGTQQKYDSNQRIIFREESYLEQNGIENTKCLNNEIIMNSCDFGLIPLQTIFDNKTIDNLKKKKKTYETYDYYDVINSEIERLKENINKEQKKEIVLKINKKNIIIKNILKNIQ